MFTLEMFVLIYHSAVVCPDQIYTGCYDGSVQAVKLNLMKNYRCWVKDFFYFRTDDHICHFCVF